MKRICCSLLGIAFILLGSTGILVLYPSQANNMIGVIFISISVALQLLGLILCIVNVMKKE